MKAILPTKRFLSLILAVALILCAAPFAAAAGEPRYYDWKQYDPRWASAVLTNKTMRQVGCLATAVAMLAVRGGLRGEGDFDPGVFAAAMRQAGGFDADNDLLWEVLPKAVPGLTAHSVWESLEGTQAEKTARLKAWLDQGYQVAVAVRGGGHWVALRAVSGGRAVMMNPGGPATDLFGTYPATGVTRAALLRAEAPEQPPQPKDNSLTAETVTALVKDLGALLAAIFRWLRTMAK